MLIDVNNVNQAESHKWIRPIFKNTHGSMVRVLHPIFQEKSIGNGLRYVRGHQVMLIDVDQAESHKWVHHIYLRNFLIIAILLVRKFTIVCNHFIYE